MHYLTSASSATDSIGQSKRDMIVITLRVILGLASISDLTIGPIRWVLTCDPTGVRDPQAFLCTDIDATPVEIRGWFVHRWFVETTFQESRAHLGVETGGQWSDLAIARMTPALLGLFSLVTLSIPQSSPAFPPDRLPGFRNANPPSATQSPPFDGCSGVRRLYQYPSSTRIAWKFRPHSGKDLPKRSATPRKMGKSSLGEKFAPKASRNGSAPVGIEHAHPDAVRRTGPVYAALEQHGSGASAVGPHFTNDIVRTVEKLHPVLHRSPHRAKGNGSHPVGEEEPSSFASTPSKLQGLGDSGSRCDWSMIAFPLSRL